MEEWAMVQRVFTLKKGVCGVGFTLYRIYPVSGGGGGGAQFCRPPPVVNDRSLIYYYTFLLINTWIQVMAHLSSPLRTTFSYISCFVILSFLNDKLSPNLQLPVTIRGTMDSSDIYYVTSFLIFPCYHSEKPSILTVVLIIYPS